MASALQPDCAHTGAWGHWGSVSSTKWEHSKAKLTPSLLQPVKVLGWKVHTCKLANSFFDGPITNLLSILSTFIEILSCARQSWGKALMISSLALVLVFFRVMVWHGSERVNGDQVRSPHREVTITATVLRTARLHTHLKISTESEYSAQKQVPHTVCKKISRAH